MLQFTVTYYVYPFTIWWWVLFFLLIFLDVSFSFGVAFWLFWLDNIFSWSLSLFWCSGVLFEVLSLLLTLTCKTLLLLSKLVIVSLLQLILLKFVWILSLIVFSSIIIVSLSLIASSLCALYAYLLSLIVITDFSNLFWVKLNFWLWEEK